jgi:hypothetical protein
LHPLAQEVFRSYACYQKKRARFGPKSGIAALKSCALARASAGADKKAY